MELTPDEFTQLSNTLNTSIVKATDKAIIAEQHREMPKTLFESLLKHATKSKTLVDYEYAKDSKWIQVKPERDGSEGIASIEICFDYDGMNMDVVCVNLKD